MGAQSQADKHGNVFTSMSSKPELSSFVTPYMSMFVGQNNWSGAFLKNALSTCVAATLLQLKSGQSNFKHQKGGNEPVWQFEGGDSFTKPESAETLCCLKRSGRRSLDKSGYWKVVGGCGEGVMEAAKRKVIVMLFPQFRS